MKQRLVISGLLVVLLTAGLLARKKLGCVAERESLDSVIALVQTNDSLVVGILDPSACLSCDATSSLFLEARRLTGAPVRVVLLRPPTDLERRQLVLEHALIDAVLSRPPEMSPRAILFVNKTPMTQMTLAEGGRLVRQLIRRSAGSTLFTSTERH